MNTEPDQDEMSMRAVELCRDFNRKLAIQQSQNGIPLPEITIGAIYSAVDIATEFTGNLPDAICWARKALDTMEDSLRLHGDEPETVQ